MTNLKKFFKFSLAAIALTLGVSVTSCDKDDNTDIVNPQLELDGGIVFSENSNISGSKDLSTSPYGKTASEFTHIFYDVQNMEIRDSDGALAWSGSYTPGDIMATLVDSDGNSGPIILPNGNYTVSTSSAGASSADVSQKLDYTSSASLTVPPGGSITLDVTHSRGFAIVNVGDAEGGSRVTGASAGSDALFLDPSSDSEGDYYGYINPQDNKEFSAAYDLDGVSTTVSGTLTIGAGFAYTLSLNLQPETPSVPGSSISTSTLASTEAAEGLNVNAAEGDEDQLDLIERIITSTQATLNGQSDGSSPTISRGDWYVTSDIDVSVTPSTVTSTEAAEGDQNNDGDTLDSLSRVDTTTVTTTTVGSGAGLEDSNTVTGVWTVTNSDASNINEPNPGDGFDNGGDDELPNGGGATNGDDTVDFSSAVWGPDFVDQIADFTQTRTGQLVQVDALGPNTPELTESRNIIVTGDSSTDWFFRLGNNGEVTGGHADQAAAEAAGEALAGSNNLQIYIFSRISTVYSADNGISFTHTVRGDLVGVRQYANPGYTAPVADVADILSPFSEWSNIAGSEVAAVNGQPVRGSLIRTEYLIGSTVYATEALAQAAVAAGSTVDIITREVFSSTIAVSAATVQQERTRTVIQQGHTLDAIPPAGDLREVRTIETASATSIAGPEQNSDSSASYTAAQAPSGTPGDLDGDGSVTYADAVMAGFSIVTVDGALGGYRFTYSAATGLADELASTSTIARALRTFDTITVALATEYAEAKVLAAYIAQL